MSSENRVCLRPITEADLPDYVRWLNDPEVTQFLTIESGGFTSEYEREWLAGIQSPECKVRPFGIEADGRHIGNCSIGPARHEQVGGIGLVIGDKTSWGKGYGTAALTELLRIGFEELGYLRIQLTVFAKNARARRCYEKSGFRYEGTQRKSFLKRGVWIDVITMAILREEWEAWQRGLAPGQGMGDRQFVQQWQRCIDVLRPKSGETIIDAGCRAAGRSLLIGAHVIPDGRVMGLDINASAIEEAKVSISEKGMQDIVSAQRADIRSLPVEDNSADAWFCRETLEYLDDPAMAIKEAFRVVRPGGRIVAMEADWDTLAYNASDKEVERRFVAVHTDCGGGGSLDGRVGRKLLSLFREAGLENVKLKAHTMWSDKYAPEECYVCYPLRQGAVERGCIKQEDLDAFYADMKTQAEKERYFHCYSYFICSGEVKKENAC
jgi:RimJ/RimL family protein N-acetyltransferase/precorrin-6B methylase 2